MSFTKAIAAGTEHRRPYRRSAAIDPSCRPGHRAPCPWCVRNRTIQTIRLRARADEESAGWWSEQESDER
jgi:hypothetical protein